MPQPRMGRYSRAVRVLRILLPLGALGLMSSVFLVTRDTFPAGIRFSASDFEALDDGLRLTAPRFSGTTEAGEPFMISADWALPDAPDPTEIRLHAIAARIEMADGRTAELGAAEGLLRPKAQTVALRGGVVLTTSDGYEARTESAQVDLRARTLTAPGAVSAEGPLGRIEAGRLDMIRPERSENPDAEELIVFRDGVRVVYQPGSADDPSSDRAMGAR